jgi:hypothetical protein
MGTRHVTQVRLDNKIMVSQYGQWDGYPLGQGKDIASFIMKNLKSKISLDTFKQSVRACKRLSAKTLNSRWEKFGADKNGMIESSKAEKFGAVYPQLTRDMGAGILNFILKSFGCEINYMNVTPKTDAWLEYSYIIDLDKKKLEVYCGNPFGKPYAKIPFSEIHGKTMSSLNKKLERRG